jgi:hypothetical protein
MTKALVTFLILFPAVALAQFKTVEDILGPELKDENQAVRVYNIIDCLESANYQQDSVLNLECTSDFSKIIVNTKINRIEMVSSSQSLHFYSLQAILSNEVNVFLSEETGDSVAVKWFENYMQMQFFFRKEKKLLTFSLE